MVSTKTTYITDGKEFDTLADAEKHEQRVEARTKEWHKRFLKSDHYKSLLKEHSLTDHGFWDVKGEDSEMRFNNHLGTVEGTLQQAINWAVSQAGWSSWGNGGRITKMDIIKL